MGEDLPPRIEVEASFPSTAAALYCVGRLMLSKLSFGYRDTQSGPRLFLQGAMDEETKNNLEKLLRSHGASEIFYVE